MTKSYKCFKCGSTFTAWTELDTDKPTCDRCLKHLLEIRTVAGYREFVSPKQEEKV